MVWGQTDLKRNVVINWKSWDRKRNNDLEWRVLDGASADEGHDDGHDVDRQLELQELCDTVVHVPSPHDGLDDAAEVVVSQNDVRGFFGNVGAGDALWE